MTMDTPSLPRARYSLRNRVLSTKRSTCTRLLALANMGGDCANSDGGAESANGTTKGEDNGGVTVAGAIGKGFFVFLTPPPPRLVLVGQAGIGWQLFRRVLPKPSSTLGKLEDTTLVALMECLGTTRIVCGGGGMGWGTRLDGGLLFCLGDDDDGGTTAKLLSSVTLPPGVVLVSLPPIFHFAVVKCLASAFLKPSSFGALVCRGITAEEAVAEFGL